ncbi:hypothetical protein CSC37_4773 [Escherichia coli]|nr:hypothetical protein PPECC33_02285 [Escherichia coli PCN033]RCH09020.1 hypothetical protein CSC37_4773 [Escherichia coli]
MFINAAKTNTPHQCNISAVYEKQPKRLMRVRPRGRKSRQE